MSQAASPQANRQGEPPSSRRTFLQSTLSSTLSAGAMVASTGAIPLGVPNIVRAENRSDKLRVVVIGCGGRGTHNFEQMLGEEVVALCDVNAKSLEAAGARVPQAKTFVDFRRLYEELPVSSYDAVVVSTPEHTHAFAVLPALRAKKHVYCEKPLTHSVREARIVTEATRAAGVATQMGTQIHADDNYRRVVELVQGGAIGPIREVHVWVDRAWGWQSPEDAKKNNDLVSTQDRPTGSSPIPPQLNWDLWLGPAPSRPFHEVYFPGPKWYRWWDFANGTMSDLGSHWIDLPFWALNLDAPKTVEAFGPPPHPELAPASMHVNYEFAARDGRGPVKLAWYQGVDKPPCIQEKQVPPWGSGMLFIGSDGQILTDYGRHMVLLGPDALDFKRPPASIPKSLGHHAEWIHAAKTGAATTCPFTYSGPLTETAHLGNVAYRSGQKLTWDAATMTIPSAPAAEAFLGREYRPGWSLG